MTKARWIELAIVMTCVLFLGISKTCARKRAAEIDTKWAKGMVFIVDDEPGVSLPKYLQVDIGFRSDGTVICRQNNVTAPVGESALRASRLNSVVNE